VVDRIAYQVVGEGPTDLLYLTSFGTDCLDVRWELPVYTAFLGRLASLTRLIMFDPRGIGTSDPIRIDTLPRWEQWADDAQAVLDAVGSEQPALFGYADSAAIAILMAATKPARTKTLIVADTAARFLRAPDCPLGLTDSDVEKIGAIAEDTWGTDAWAAYAVPKAADPALRAWMVETARISSNAKSFVAFQRALSVMDLRAVLPSIQVPTPVMH
jgi:pimeloyl-ACP methyl ester carboxylesterase